MAFSTDPEVRERAQIIPRISVITPFDVRFPHVIRFTFAGYRQIEANRITIRSVPQGTIVMRRETEGVGLEHTIPAQQNSLEFINGRRFTIEVEVRQDGEWSPPSNRVNFMTMERPILDILTITDNAEVHNHSVEFRAMYSQANNERIRRYRWTLFDSNMDRIQVFPDQVPLMNRRPGDNFDIISQLITGLRKFTSYFVKVEIETINGFMWSATRSFRPLFLTPSAGGVVYAEPNSEDGFITLTSKLVQITGNKVYALPEDVSPDMRNEFLLYNGTGNAYPHNFVSGGTDSTGGRMIEIPIDKGIVFRELNFGATWNFFVRWNGIPLKHGTKFLHLASENGDASYEFWYYEQQNPRRGKVCCFRNMAGSPLRSMTFSNTINREANDLLLMNMVNVGHTIEIMIHGQSTSYQFEEDLKEESGDDS